MLSAFGWHQMKIDPVSKTFPYERARNLLKRGIFHLLTIPALHGILFLRPRTL